MMRFLLFFTFCLLCTGVVARAADYNAHYSIYRNDEKIGHYHFDVREKAEKKHVSVKMNIEASLLFLPVYGARHERTEIWHNDRLLELKGSSNYNDQLYDVSLEAESGQKYKLSVNGEEEELEAFVMTLTPWLIVGWEEAVLLTEKGKTKTVKTNLEGLELIGPEDKQQKAFHYALSGDITRDLWYSSQGRLLKLSYEKDGAVIRFELDQNQEEHEVHEENEEEKPDGT